MEGVAKSSNLARKHFADNYFGSFYPEFPVAFTLSFEGKYKEFAYELVRKTNERFIRYGFEIPFSGNRDIDGEIRNISMFNRMCLTTTIAQDSVLRSYGFLPITPRQAENLRLVKELPHEGKYSESLALIVCNALNDNSLETRSLLDSLKGESKVFEFYSFDSDFAVINPGVNVDKSGNLVPVAIPGVSYPSLISFSNRSSKSMLDGCLTDDGIPYRAKRNTKKHRGFIFPKKHLRTGLYDLDRCYDGSLLVRAFEEDSSFDRKLTFAVQKIF